MPNRLNARTAPAIRIKVCAYSELRLEFAIHLIAYIFIYWFVLVCYWSAILVAFFFAIQEARTNELMRLILAVAVGVVAVAVLFVWALFRKRLP